MRMTKSRRISLVRMLLTFSGLTVLVLTAPVNSYAFDTAAIDWAIRELCGHITGGLGGLLTATAILGAIVAAAMGSYRTFFGAIIVGIGAFATPDIVNVHFPAAGSQCNTGAGSKTSEVMTTNLKGQLVTDAAEENAATEVAKAGTATASRVGTNTDAKTDLSDEDADAARSWEQLSSEEEES